MTCHLGHTKCKRPAEVASGDIVLFLGSPHLVDRVDAYDGPHDFVLGVARAADGWGISLAEPTCVEVA